MNSLFDLPQVAVEKPIRLITLFSGIGSQEMALRDIGADFERWRAVEFDKFAIAGYNAIHGTDFPVLDIKDVSGKDLEIVDTDKYDYIFVYSFPCFTEDALVLTDKGYKKIVDVKKGDFVLTHANNWKKVVRFCDNGKKQVYKISAMPIDELKCTGNHKFYTREMYRTYPRYVNGKRGSERHFKEPVWKECKDLTKKDYLGIAINQKEEFPDWNGIEIKWEGRKRIERKNDLKPLFSKGSFWWLMGYYLGDGWQRSANGYVSGIVLAANDTKLKKLKSKLNDVGFEYCLADERTVHKVHICSRELGAFVEMFGKYAYGKRVPTEVLNLPKDLLFSFLEGYFAADGYYCAETKFQKATSVSKELIYGIGQCVAKAYHRPYSISKTKRKPTCVIEGRMVNQKDSYNIAFKMSKDKQDKAFYEDGYLWCPINKTEKLGLENVYDIEVEDDHSFTANGVIVHNCQALSLAGKMGGMKEGSGTTSSLLWEVKRLLAECSDLSKSDPKYGMPKILLMENVPQVHSEQNIHDFEIWLNFLREKGYFNHYEDLNAADFGIPQHRDRCFCISILSDEFVDFEFPKPMELDYAIKDFLEDSVEEKYYINKEKSDKLISQLEEEGKLPMGD